jgi:DNA-binding transcriptional ArsR family regulator
MIELGGPTMDAIQILTDEDEVTAAIRALNDESRRQILHALRARSMSTSELCDFLQKHDPDKEVKPQTVRYHLKELERSGLIRQDGYTPAGNGDSHIMTKMWRATAETVFIATGSLEELPDRVPFEMERSLDLVGTMREIGFDIPDDSSMRQLAEQFSEQDRLWRKGRDRAKRALRGTPEINPDVYLTLRRLLSVISLDDVDFEQYCDLSRELFHKFRKAFRDGKGDNPEVY